MHDPNLTARTRIALATPHARYDRLARTLSLDPRFDVLRLRTREDLTLDRLRTFDPRFVFFPHWSWRIPKEIFEAFECVVFHMTDLPFGRGGSPLQNLVVQGVEQTKLTALKCVDELDAGPVYLKVDLSTLGTAEEVYARAATLMESMIEQIALGALTPTLQSGPVVRFERRRPEQSDIAALTTLLQVHDWIRMLDAEGYPKAFLAVGNLRLEFTRASLHADKVLADVRISVEKGPASE
jgi:methionyl-tRNA formyltransferase